MSLSKPFILRPVMTLLISLSFAFFGALAYRSLPVSDLPNVDTPTIRIFTAYPGASSKEVAQMVTEPLEKEMMTIAGVQALNSNSSNGASHLTVEFHLDKDMDVATAEVARAIDNASLPQEIAQRPYYTKSNPAAAPILYLCLKAQKAKSSVDLYNLAKYHIANRLSSIKGVAQVRIWGEPKAFYIRISPETLASLNLTLEEIAQKIQTYAATLPTGSVDLGTAKITLTTQNALCSLSDIQKIVLKTSSSIPAKESAPMLTLGEIAEIEEGVENEPSHVRYLDSQQNQPAIILPILKQPGSNTMEVSKNIHKLLAQINSEIGPSAQVEVLFDRSILIDRSLSEVKETLLLAIGLVILTIFFYLGKASETLIPTIVIPLSLLSTFICMYFLDYSLNNLTLLALTLAIGFVVDDAIVVMENIVRLKEKGLSTQQAAIQGASEVTFTILSMTLSLIAVFIPFLLMPGLLGKFLKEFSATLAIAVAISGVISLTLTPMLMSRRLEKEGKEKITSPSLIEKSALYFNQFLLSRYQPCLRAALNHPKTTLSLFFLSLVATYALSRHMTVEFIPDDDSGYIVLVIQADPLASPYYTLDKLKQAEEKIRTYPFIKKGMSNLLNDNTAYFFLCLTPQNERLPIGAIADLLKKELSSIIGIHIWPRIQPTLQLPSFGNQNQSYSYLLKGLDLDTLEQAANHFSQELQQLPFLQNVTLQQGAKEPQLHLCIDSELAALYQVPIDAIQRTLQSAFSSKEVAKIFEKEGRIPLFLQLKVPPTQKIQALQNLFVRNKQHTPIPLINLISMQETLAPTDIRHVDQMPAIQLSFDLAPGVSLESALAAIEQVKTAALPPSIKGAPNAVAQEFTLFLQSIVRLLLLATLVMYVILGILYESLIHPLTILSSLPIAIFGALLTLLLFSKSLSFYAFIGLILLIGIVKKNGIMIVDQALALSHQLKAKEAVYQACLIRFRPIMMTTFAAICGALPIAIGFGAQGSARQGLGLTIVGGLLFSQFFTLIFTPILYLYFEKLQRRFSSHAR